MSHTAMLKPGFSEPVHASQQVFRRALTALAEPGQVQSVTNAPALDALDPATYVLCLCLLDSDTSVWLSPALDTPTLRANLAFHCGCPIVAQPELAAFALLTANDAAQLPAFNPGTDRDPDLSCTLLIQLASLTGGPSATWQGPGIRDKRAMSLPLPESFWAKRDAHGFPKGLDCFLTAGEAFVGLPRSTRVTRMMQEVI